MEDKLSLNTLVSFNPGSLYHWKRQCHPTPVLLPGKSHGRRSLVGCSPWGRWESGTTERLHFHFSLSCIGEGNGNPLQCSCLENPVDGGAWWAAVYGVAQSWTRLKWLSCSSIIIKPRRALCIVMYNKISFRNLYHWTSLAVQGLRLCSSSTGGTGLISGGELRFHMLHCVDKIY